MIFDRNSNLFFVDCLVVKCTELTEERISSIRDKLQQWFDDAAWHAPSIILFDDLDRLIPAEIEVCILIYFAVIYS